MKQTIITLLIKLFKTISIKHNLKQNVTIYSSIAHGFLFIITAEMVNDLKHSRARRQPPNKSSHQLSTITENPLDESSDISNDPTIPSHNPSGLFHRHSSIYTKSPKRIPRNTRFKIIPKR